MDRATPLLVQYARYHRDPRNIATHFVGIPLIVFAIGVLLARWRLDLPGGSVGADVIAWALAAGWYLTRGAGGLGVATAAAVGGLVALGHPFGTASTGTWLTAGVGVFVVGWVWQFVGHYWEGRKPAFFDDVRGLLVGPMFVVAEAGFLLGAGAALKARIEAEAGPVARQTGAREQRA